jgi:hypothetical protein
MDDDFPFEPIPGLIQKQENELADGIERRILIHREDRTLIGRAASLMRMPTSQHYWQLVDITCVEPLPTIISVVIEDWILDAVVFYEGFGFKTATTHTSPSNISLNKNFCVIDTQSAFSCPNRIMMYRMATLKNRD